MYPGGKPYIENAKSDKKIENSIDILYINN